MLHKLADDTYGISAHQVWLPGAFVDTRAARYAFRFPDEVLTTLQERVNPDGCITFEMLQETRRDLRDCGIVPQGAF